MFNHIKKSVIAFDDFEHDPAFEHSYMKPTAYAQYLSLVRDFEKYENEQYLEFLQFATHVVNKNLKRNILKLTMCDGVVKGMFFL